jgi:hypothetical protein
MLKKNQSQFLLVLLEYYYILLHFLFDETFLWIVIDARSSVTTVHVHPGTRVRVERALLDLDHPLDYHPVLLVLDLQVALKYVRFLIFLFSKRNCAQN